MHYRNGREAKNGDKVVKLGGASNAEVVTFGVLHSAVIVSRPITTDTCACMCDMLHVDDLAVILKEKGLDKRPADK